MIDVRFRFNCRLAKIAEVKSKLHGAGGFRENLKSTGQPKFAIDEKEEGVSENVEKCVGLSSATLSPRMRSYCSRQNTDSESDSVKICAFDRTEFRGNDAAIMHCNWPIEVCKPTTALEYEHQWCQNEMHKFEALR
jgi:hypothetical protein